MNADIINQAKELAKLAHKDQKWGSNTYFVHLSLVANEMEFWINFYNIQGSIATSLVCAGWLHDLLEDCPGYTYEIVKEVYGQETADLVFSVTDEPGKNRQEKKSKTYPKIKQNKYSILLKLCDRIVNVSNCAGVYSRHPDPKDQYFLNIYRKEQAEFSKQLKTDDWPEVWEKLEKLLQGKKD